MSHQSETDFEQSIEELERSPWPDAGPDATPMVERCHALRKKRMRELTDDEVRLAVGQQIGFPFILDLAFERLKDEPLLDGGCYPGDILAGLIRAPNEAWSERPELREKLMAYFDYAMSQPTELTDAFREILNLPATGRSAH